MIRSLTLVPSDFLDAARDFLTGTRVDPAIRVIVTEITSVYFGGSTAVAGAASDGRGLACVRLLGSGVFHVDLDGYEGSCEHLARYVLPTIELYRCRVFDDETGRELTQELLREPALLLGETRSEPTAP